MRDDNKPQYWHCFVGLADNSELEDGCDLPMRIAVDAAFKKITGRDPLITSSGWGISEEEKDAMEKAEMGIKYPKKTEEKESKDNTGLVVKYFVLKPKGDDRYAEASRKAMRAYANHIDGTNKYLASDLRDWAKRESLDMLRKREE